MRKYKPSHGYKKYMKIIEHVNKGYNSICKNCDSLLTPDLCGTLLVDRKTFSEYDYGERCDKCIDSYCIYCEKYSTDLTKKVCAMCRDSL
jgi:hypothetical protein